MGIFCLLPLHWALEIATAKAPTDESHGWPACCLSGLSVLGGPPLSWKSNVGVLGIGFKPFPPQGETGSFRIPPDNVLLCWECSFMAIFFLTFLTHFGVDIFLNLIFFSLWWTSLFSNVYLVFIFFFFWVPPKKFLGRGSNLSHSSDLAVAMLIL